MMVRNSNGDMIPLGTVAKITPAVGPVAESACITLSVGHIIGLPATGYSSGQSMNLMEEIAARRCRRARAFEWTAMSYQERSSAVRSTGRSALPAAGLSRAGRTI
jgi:HAE1 family hydrophobic/amphiphilic exporter-1